MIPVPVPRSSRAPADAVLHETREQHRIHAKAESRRILNDLEAAPLKVVDLLSRLQELLIVLHNHSVWPAS